ACAVVSVQAQVEKGGLAAAAQFPFALGIPPEGVVEQGAEIAAGQLGFAQGQQLEGGGNHRRLRQGSRRRNIVGGRAVVAGGEAPGGVELVTEDALHTGLGGGEGGNHNADTGGGVGGGAGPGPAGSGGDLLPQGVGAEPGCRTWDRRGLMV